VIVLTNTGKQMFWRCKSTGCPST